MSTSVPLLFNALNLATSVASHGVDELQLASASRLMQTMFSDYPFEVDALELMVRRHGNSNARIAFGQCMQAETTRMREHPLWVEQFPRGGMLVALTIRLEHLKGLQLTTLEDVAWELNDGFSRTFGLKGEQFVISPLLYPAEDLFEASPYGILQRCRSSLNDMLQRVRDPQHRSQQVNRCPREAAEAQPVPCVREYVMFVAIDDSAEGAPAVRSIIEKLPARFGLLRVKTSLDGAPAYVHVDFTMTHVGSAYDISRSALYSANVFQIFSSCYGASLSTAAAFNAHITQTPPEQMARALLDKHAHVQFIQTKTGLGARISILERSTQKLLGGVFIDDVLEPSALMSRMTLLFPSRVSHNHRITEAPANDRENGLIHFFSPATQSWSVPELRIRVEL